MSKAYFRQEISYDHWTALEPREPAQTTQLGGVEQDNRRLVDTVFWNCAYRRALARPVADYSDWKNFQRRICRWRDNGRGSQCGEGVALGVNDDGGRHCKVTHTPPGARGGGSQRILQHQDTSGRGCVWQRLHVICPPQAPPRIANRLPTLPEA